jgi:hypothetical protein
MAKKIAMVQPKADQPMGTVVQLALLLQHMGNNRAYTVISHQGNVWMIMFEGDYAPTELIYEGEKSNVGA